MISSRSVIERRQQIGMLRAIGYSRRRVQWAFLLESSFTAILGLVIGTLLGVWSAAQTATLLIPSRNVFQDTAQLPFLELACILVCSYLATLLTTYMPAQAAAKVRPAEALRYE
ncbi:MAG TPA: FtsX-like permease family protein [Ktedonobacteraceae bacterium]|nr:FtsX-like permease family protein [Ktedonobacteraceae bacterium]